MCPNWGSPNSGVWPKGEYALAVSRLENVLFGFNDDRLFIPYKWTSRDGRLRPVRCGPLAFHTLRLMESKDNAKSLARSCG
jgi:hypothetical protein